MTSLDPIRRHSLHGQQHAMKLVILLHSLYWSIHTKDESKRGTAFAFIFGVNWLWSCGVMASFGVFLQEMKCNAMASFMEFMMAVHGLVFLSDISMLKINLSVGRSLNLNLPKCCIKTTKTFNLQLSILQCTISITDRYITCVIELFS